MGEVSLGDDEKILEIDGGDSCTRVNVLDATEMNT